MAIQLNLEYFFQLPGILKLSQLVLSIVCMICAGVGQSRYDYSSHGARGFVWFTLAVALIACLVTVVLMLFRIGEALKGPIWILVECAWAGILAFFYFVSMAISGKLSHYIGGIPLDKAYKSGDAWAACSVFCALTIVLYAVEAVISFRLFYANRNSAHMAPTATYMDTPAPSAQP